jgi:transketolase
VELNKLYCFGGPDRFLTACGNQNEARQEIGLTAENITAKILQVISEK